MNSSLHIEMFGRVEDGQHVLKLCETNYRETGEDDAKTSAASSIPANRNLTAWPANTFGETWVAGQGLDSLRGEKHPPGYYDAM